MKNERITLSHMVKARKFYIRRNNNKFSSFETGRIVIAHFFLWSGLEKWIYSTFF